MLQILFFRSRFFLSLGFVLSSRSISGYPYGLGQSTNFSPNILIFNLISSRVMKVSYLISSLFLLLPVILALPYQPANNAEGDKYRALQVKRQHDGSAYNVLASTIDSDKDIHDSGLNRQKGAATGHYGDERSGTQKREESTKQEIHEHQNPACHHRPYKQGLHHQQSKHKSGAGVTNSNQTNSPAHAQANANVMPAVAPQPMAGSSTGQAPPPAPGTMPDPNSGGPPHQDLPPRQLAGRSDPPGPVPSNSTGKHCHAHPQKYVNHALPKNAGWPNYRPAALGGVAPQMGHGPVVPGRPWTPASGDGPSPGTTAPTVPRDMNAIMASPKFRSGLGRKLKRFAQVTRPQSHTFVITNARTAVASGPRARARASRRPGRWARQ